MKPTVYEHRQWCFSIITSGFAKKIMAGSNEQTWNFKCTFTFLVHILLISSFIEVPHNPQALLTDKQICESTQKVTVEMYLSLSRLRERLYRDEPCLSAGLCERFLLLRSRLLDLRLQMQIIIIQIHNTCKGHGQTPHEPTQTFLKWHASWPWIPI